MINVNNGSGNDGFVPSGQIYVAICGYIIS